jgi:virginiamycin B lyase
VIVMKNFPEKPRPPAVVIAGPVQASIKLWDVPTIGSRPHDPLATKDGAIWWAGQLSNKLGRIDPKTGAIREYSLKTPHSGPHGLKEDKAGNIWFTGNVAGLIGKLDPKTGLTTEYKLPSPQAKDPHTLVVLEHVPADRRVASANAINVMAAATGGDDDVLSRTIGEILRGSLAPGGRCAAQQYGG